MYLWSVQISMEKIMNRNSVQQQYNKYLAGLCLGSSIDFVTEGGRVL